MNSGNKYPIILVHGYSGWGREELGSTKFRYWGGLQDDLQEQLVGLGYTVYTATVGPFSSNWDRACELYAQIKGGQVDYGARHSASHHHARMGRAFKGLYPRWGEVGADGTINKVHLIGHSMGGQTIRMLAQLLAKGSKGAPVEEDASTHPLFAGGKDWVHSITTVSTPNQGTRLADEMEKTADLLKKKMVTFFAILNMVGDKGDDFFDAKLDQWGIVPRADDETPHAYIDRVSASPIFAAGHADLAAWSLSTAGAEEENKWVTTLKNVYYFSYATSDTHASRSYILFGAEVHRPNMVSMSATHWDDSSLLGGRSLITDKFSEEWQENDGAVNTISMRKCTSGKYVEFDGVARLGVWNGMPTINDTDHIAVVGHTLLTEGGPVLKLFSGHAEILSTLPAHKLGTEGLASTASSPFSHVRCCGQLCERWATGEMRAAWV